MHGLGEILKMNKRLGETYGQIGRNGTGTPWEVRWPEGAHNMREEKPFRVVRVSDDAVLGSHESLKLARRQVAAFMMAAAEGRIR
jgi:hypothetical protein